MVKKNELPEKRKRFVEEYLKDLNGTQAYLRAGYRSKNPDVDCQKILGNSRVQAYMQMQMGERARRTEINQDLVLAELAKIASADIKDFLSFRTEKVDTGKSDGKGNTIYFYQQVIELKPSNTVDGAPISEIILSKDGAIRIKLYDKIAALEKLGKHLGMFSDRSSANIVVSSASDNDSVETAVREIIELPEEERNRYIDKLAKIAKGEDFED